MRWIMDLWVNRPDIGKTGVIITLSMASVVAVDKIFARKVGFGWQILLFYP